jgi:DNA-directed RNA polymerase beta' subunit
MYGVCVGAKFIIRHDGVRVDLRYVRNKNDLSLEHGWIVERHLRDDDYIIFNRQPSLHKMSIMGHKVKVKCNCYCCNCHTSSVIVVTVVM